MAGKAHMQRDVRRRFAECVARGMPPNLAAVESVKAASAAEASGEAWAVAPSAAAAAAAAAAEPNAERFVVGLSLAEGETLRRVLHTPRAHPSTCRLGFRGACLCDRPF